MPNTLGQTSLISMYSKDFMHINWNTSEPKPYTLNRILVIICTTWCNMRKVHVMPTASSYEPDINLKKTKQAKYVYRNIKVRSRNHCCRGKAKSFSYSVARRYQVCNAHAPYYSVIYGVSGSTIFSTLSHKRHDCRGEKAIEHKSKVIPLQARCGPEGG